jgi:hypothetical protein
VVTDLDSLLWCLAGGGLTDHERLQLSDMLVDVGREDEAARLRCPGRVLVRHQEDRWTVEPTPAFDLVTWVGVAHETVHRPFALGKYVKQHSRGCWGRFSARHSQRVLIHSLTGFDWGYFGSGPAQLALALLLQVAPREVSIEKHQDFKRLVIAQLPESGWELSEEQVCRWLDDDVIPAPALSCLIV